MRSCEKQKKYFFYIKNKINKINHTLGAPKLYSITTLRPFGPRVTSTASANLSHPFSILYLQSDPKEIFLEI